MRRHTTTLNSTLYHVITHDLNWVVNTAFAYVWKTDRVAPRARLRTWGFSRRKWGWCSRRLRTWTGVRRGGKSDMTMTVRRTTTRRGAGRTCRAYGVGWPWMWLQIEREGVVGVKREERHVKERQNSCTLGISWKIERNSGAKMTSTITAGQEEGWEWCQKQWH
jgi:hypothetical protein